MVFLPAFRSVQHFVFTFIVLRLKVPSSAFRIAIFVSLLTVMSFKTARSSTVSCRNNWLAFQDFCYYIDFGNLLGYDAADQNCISQESRLASIHSQAEQDFLTGYYTPTYRWIGLNDRRIEGTYEWVDGTQFNFNNFAPGLPDASGAATEDCIYMDQTSWNDLHCTIPSGFICKRPKDCQDYVEATQKFFQSSAQATECLEGETINGTVSDTFDPKIVEFSYRNGFDHRNRSIHRFSFDETLLSSGNAAGSDYSVYSSHPDAVLPVLQIGDIAAFNLTLYFQSLGDSIKHLILDNKRYEATSPQASTYSFTLEPPIEVGPGDITIVVSLTDVQWPANMSTAPGSSHLFFLSCLNGAECGSFADEWKNLTAEFESLTCPYFQGSEYMAYEQACNAGEPSGSCEDNWKSFQDFCYYVNTDSLLPFAEAEQWCISNGAHLTSIHSDAEQAFLADFFLGLNLWIGLNDKETEGTFKWVDSTELVFRNFAADQPDDAGGDEDCVHFTTNAAWNDWPCTNVAGFICKKRRESFLPTTLSLPAITPTKSSDGPSLAATTTSSEDQTTALRLQTSLTTFEGTSHPILSTEKMTTYFTEGNTTASRLQTATKAIRTTTEKITGSVSTPVINPVNKELEELANINVTEENVADVTENLTQLVGDDTEIDDEGLQSIAEILSGIVAVETPSVNVTESVVRIVDDILSNYDEESVQDEDVTVTEAPNQIQRSLETQITTLQTNYPDDFVIEENQVAVRGVKVQKESLVNSNLVFESIPTGDTLKNSTRVKTGEPPDRMAEAAISLSLPSNIFNSTGGNLSTVPVSFFIYQNTKLFPSSRLVNDSMEQNFRRSVGSRVISATVEGIDVIDLPEDSPVELRFALVSAYNKDNETIHNQTCVFWDVNANSGLGDWSQEGCQLNQTLPDGGAVCHCKHLTSFAVLVDIYGQSATALDVISKIGCGISITCLLITLVTYLSRRNLRQKTPKKILINFCFSLLFLYFVFITGIEQTKPQAGCVVVSVLLHYFSLTSMAWMGVEAANMFILFILVVGVYISKFTLKAGLVAWGSPAVIVVIVLIIDYTQYLNKEYCFVQIGNAFYYAQLLPMGIVIAGNFVIFVLVMHKLTFGRKSSSRDLDKRKETLKRVQNAVSITLLLGLTWVFGLLSLIHKDASYAFQVLFCIFNSLQGFFVFIMFCVRQGDVLRVWREWFACTRVGRQSDVSLTSGINTNTATRGTSLDFTCTIPSNKATPTDSTLPIDGLELDLMKNTDSSK